MIATLGIMSIARGAALTLAGGRTITGYSRGFRWIGSGTIGGTGIPVQIVFMLLLYLLMFYILRFRKTGRYIYSIGGNEEATRLSGIDVKTYKALSYVVCGIMASIAGIILVSKLNSAQSIAGEGYELDAIASSVIGGASLLGGAGSVWGTLLGAITMGIIRNGLNLMNVSSYTQRLIIGVIIIAAVLLDSLRSGKTSRFA
jgi:ribose transport system permease protein